MADQFLPNLDYRRQLAEIRRQAQDEIERLIGILDRIDPDPDIEEAAEDDLCDLERSGEATLVSTQCEDMSGQFAPTFDDPEDIGVDDLPHDLDTDLELEDGI